MTDFTDPMERLLAELRPVAPSPRVAHAVARRLRPAPLLALAGLAAALGLLTWPLPVSQPTSEPVAETVLAPRCRDLAAYRAALDRSPEELERFLDLQSDHDDPPDSTRATTAMNATYSD